MFYVIRHICQSVSATKLSDETPNTTTLADRVPTDSLETTTLADSAPTTAAERIPVTVSNRDIWETTTLADRAPTDDWIPITMVASE